MKKKMRKQKKEKIIMDNNFDDELEMNDEKDNQNQISINDQLSDKEEIKIERLINSVFKDKSKKPEILEKLRPFFSLKVIPSRQIDRVYVLLKLFGLIH